MFTTECLLRPHLPAPFNILDSFSYASTLASSVTSFLGVTPGIVQFMGICWHPAFTQLCGPSMQWHFWSYRIWLRGSVMCHVFQGQQLTMHQTKNSRPGILCLMHSKLLFASSMVPYIWPALALLFTIDVIWGGKWQLLNYPHPKEAEISYVLPQNCLLGARTAPVLRDTFFGCWQWILQKQYNGFSNMQLWHRQSLL